MRKPDKRPKVSTNVDIPRIIRILVITIPIAIIFTGLHIFTPKLGAAAVLLLCAALIVMFAYWTKTRKK